MCAMFWRITRAKRPSFSQEHKNKKTKTDIHLKQIKIISTIN